MKKILSIVLVAFIGLFAPVALLAGSAEISRLVGLGIGAEKASIIDAQYGTARTASDVPSTTNAIDLGSSSKKFRRAWIGTNVLFPTATVAGAGTNQATCTAITEAQQFSKVTGADATVGVCLPAITANMLGGRWVVVNSDTTNALKVYAAASETITGQAGATAISVAAKLFLDCVAFSTSAWFCSKGVLPY